MADGTPIMPTKASRARRMVRDGKAIGKRNKLGIYYIQLIDEPSSREKQKAIALFLCLARNFFDTFEY